MKLSTVKKPPSRSVPVGPAQSPGPLFVCVVGLVTGFLLSGCQVATTAQQGDVLNRSDGTTALTVNPNPRRDVHGEYIPTDESYIGRGEWICTPTGAGTYPTCFPRHAP